MKGHDKLPPEVRALVSRSAIGTPAHVDALLALRRSAPQPVSLADIADAARVPHGTVAQRCADDLVAAGLAVSIADARTYRYMPATAELRESVDALAAVHARRPAALVRALYAHGAEPRRETRGG